MPLNSYMMELRIFCPTNLVQSVQDKKIQLPCSIFGYNYKKQKKVPYSIDQHYIAIWKFEIHFSGKHHIYPQEHVIRLLLPHRGLHFIDVPLI